MDSTSIWQPCRTVQHALREGKRRDETSRVESSFDFLYQKRMVWLKRRKREEQWPNRPEWGDSWDLYWGGGTCTVEREGPPQLSSTLSLRTLAPTCTRGRLSFPHARLAAQAVIQYPIRTLTTLYRHLVACLDHWVPFFSSSSPSSLHSVVCTLHSALCTGQAAITHPAAVYNPLCTCLLGNYCMRDTYVGT
jgi:hypothetical protein